MSVSVASASTASTAPAANSAPVPATAPASEYRVLAPAKTPIKHLVVIFDENNSFDHYFGTYPKAANTDGTTFHAKKGTPKVNGLTTQLLKHNPNEFNPQRLSHSEALTCDQNHAYTAEQKAFNGGKMDKFVQNTESDGCSGEFGPPGIVMDYYDGNRSPTRAAPWARWTPMVSAPSMVTSTPSTTTAQTATTPAPTRLAS